jgi:hypothetical protein
MLTFRPSGCWPVIVVSGCGRLPPFPSEAAGVFQPAKFACLGNWSNRSEPSPLGLMSAPLSFQSLVVVVTQPAKFASLTRQAQPCFVPCFSFCPSERPVVSCACGVVQPLSNKPEPLSDMRGADARSAQICRPNGVARCFHVSAYSVEPAEAVLARNLLSKDDWRAALCDEPMELRPEVALVFDALALTGGAEGLAGTASGPDGSVVGPSGEAEGVAPDADTGEEVALRVTLEVARSHVPN